MVVPNIFRSPMKAPFPALQGTSQSFPFNMSPQTPPPVEASKPHLQASPIYIYTQIHCGKCGKYITDYGTFLSPDNDDAAAAPPQPTTTTTTTSSHSSPRSSSPSEHGCSDIIPKPGDKKQTSPPRSRSPDSFASVDSHLPTPTPNPAHAADAAQTTTLLSTLADLREHHAALARHPGVYLTAAHPDVFFRTTTTATTTNTPITNSMTRRNVQHEHEKKKHHPPILESGPHGIPSTTYPARNTILVDEKCPRVLLSPEFCTHEGWDGEWVMICDESKDL